MLRILVFVVLAVVIGIIFIATFDNYKKCDHFDTDQDLSTIVHAQVVFRHGDRSMDPEMSYPNDPHKNHSYFPYHHGNLNKNGKLRSYNVGKELRLLYDKFLGHEYYSGIVQSFASNYDRTQMTLQCVLAGLFSTIKSPIPNLNWRPIKYEVFETDEDKFIGVMKNCPNMPKPKGKPHPQDEEAQNLFKYISEKSGYPVKTFNDMLHLQDILYVEESNGLRTPDWTRSDLMKARQKYVYEAWKQFSKENLRFGCGALLKLMTEFALKKVANSDEVYNRKLVLYSGHDYNIIFLLNALGAWDGNLAGFSTFISFELHKIEGIYGFKVRYRNHLDKNAKLLRIPYCKGSFCPLDVFVANTKWIYEPEPKCAKFELV